MRDTDEQAEKQRSEEARDERRPLEEVGAVPQRAAVGQRARERRPQSVEAWNDVTHDQSRSRAYHQRRGRHRRILRRQHAALLLARRCGTARTRSSRSGCSASPTARATTARTSRSTTSTSTARRRTRTRRCSTSTRRRRSRTTQLRRGEPARARKTEFEYELLDTGVFDEDRYWDVFVEFAKADPEDILIRITAVNRGPEAAPLHLLPQLWFRNTWWADARGAPARARGRPPRQVRGHRRAPPARSARATSTASGAGELLFTDNETNRYRLWGQPNPTHVPEGRHQRLRRQRARRTR